MTNSNRVLGWAFGALGLVACGGAVDDPYGANTPPKIITTGDYRPAIRIVSPAAGSVTLGADPLRTVPIEISLPADFTLAAPGACTNTTNCGHVHINIDQSATQPDGRCPDKPYNNSIISGVRGEARFACLAKPGGSHIISVDLHRNDHTPFPNVESRAEVVVTASPANVGFPLTIASPTMEAMVTPAMNPNLTVDFTPVLNNFTLGAPGTCAGNVNCGHMRLSIDPHLGTAYNCDGNPFNNSGAAATIKAWFRCVPEAKRHGPHIIGITLHRDDGTPFMMTPEMKPVGAWVRVNIP